MKFLLAFVALIAVSHAIVLLPEDLPQRNQMGQCRSGLPWDGTFESGALGSPSEPNSWRVGALRSGKTIDPSAVTFESGFTRFPAFFDIPQQQGAPSTSQFSLRIRSEGVIFQFLHNIAYAHYRLSACARVHGDIPCRVEIRNNANEIMDYLDFLPDKNVTESCVSSPEAPVPKRCVAHCAEGQSLTALTVRYSGSYPAMLLLRVPGQEEQSGGMIIDLMPGQEFNITADMFAGMEMGNSTENSTSTTLPEFIEFVENPDSANQLIDVFSTNCSSLSALPGNRFGDKRHFVVTRAWDGNNDPICPISKLASSQTCACETDVVEERCLLSDKGFVATPDAEYYIGLISQGCSCSFDNVCLDSVNGEEGYFGLDWLQVPVSSNATTM